MDNLTHASFFSGVGGLDMGLERAGWRTVSFSEIDPYASAVLAQRWPGVPNLGNVVALAQGVLGSTPTGVEPRHAYHDATLWTGGFPCQDLSVAGKRRGMGAGTRSGLAYAFLDLVGRHRPRFVFLENVPGLLSSHAGRDFGTLLDTLVQLGYGVGYRVLDARYFGVPQRRRRVFILGISPGGRAGAERAAEVLSVGSRCRRHPPTGVEAGEGVAEGVALGVDIARAVTGTSGKRHDDDTDTLVSAPIRGNPYGDHISAESHLISSSPDPSRVRTADGLAGRSHDRDGVADTLTAPDTRHRVIDGKRQDGSRLDRIPWVVNALDQRRGGADDNEAQAGHLVAFNPYRTLERDGSVTSGYAAREVVDALHGPTGNKEPLVAVHARDMGQVQAHSGERAALQEPDDASVMAVLEASPFLPVGLDSHRYRCCGNGVVSDVTYWIGLRLAALP